MSIIFNPYINFSGKCREAMGFYKACFGGELVDLQSYEEARVPTEDAYKHYILHSELRGGAVHLMASDGRPGQPAKMGDYMSLSLNFTDVNEQAKIFAALAQGGTVTQPLEDAFWGARFGMLVDKYGIAWQFNCATK
jgi:PhnB protein